METKFHECNFYYDNVWIKMIDPVNQKLFTYQYASRYRSNFFEK